LVVRDNDPADPGGVAQQIHNIDICNATCTDQQISVHAPN
jgi:hypothetical protein